MSNGKNKRSQDLLDEATQLSREVRAKLDRLVAIADQLAPDTQAHRLITLRVRRELQEARWALDQALAKFGGEG